MTKIVDFNFNPQWVYQTGIDEKPHRRPDPGLACSQLDRSRTPWSDLSARASVPRHVNAILLAWLASLAGMSSKTASRLRWLMLAFLVACSRGDGAPPDAGPVSTDYIYYVDDDTNLQRFDPVDSTFTTIGTIRCPAVQTTEAGYPGRPFSLAIDGTGMGWLSYTSGQIFQVSIADASCADSGFRFDQDGRSARLLSLGFANDEMGAETLYVVQGYTDASGLLWAGNFQRLALDTLTVKDLGQPSYSQVPKLSASPDGTLFGYFGSEFNGAPAIAEIDVRSGETRTIVRHDGNPAFTVWGGEFWGIQALGFGEYVIRHSAPTGDIHDGPQVPFVSSIGATSMAAP